MAESVPRNVVTTGLVKSWLRDMTDQIGKAAIADRIDRMKQGNFGKIDSIKSEPSLFEMIVDEGPGYRVYYAEFEGEVVVLILGGPKSTQKADIKKAGSALKWLRAKAEQEKAARAARQAKSASKTIPKRK